MRIVPLGEIRALLPSIDLVAEIERAFVAYSRGESVVPPVGELVFDDPPGDVHIKYGYLTNDDCYVIKIASGFYENARLGLATSNGLMLVFDRRTGAPQAVLVDECHLTDVRTAVAGAIAARYLAPDDVRRIGIAGTGVQARLQLEHLTAVTDCRDVLVWGRDAGRLELCRGDMAALGFDVKTTSRADDLLESCNLVVTTTAATKPVLSGRVRAGTHITAVGSDTHDKQELDVAILAEADLVVADSIPQCMERGEISQALRRGVIFKASIVELGSIIAGDAPGRSSPDQVTVADLTGVAVQDIAIAKAVLRGIGSGA